MEAEAHLESIASAISSELADLKTSLTPSLLQLQQSGVGLCLLQPLPPASNDVMRLQPLWMAPIGLSHTSLLSRVNEGSVIVFNASGAGKTKLAYSLSMVCFPHLYFMLTK